jgi:hypothetical protein
MGKTHKKINITREVDVITCDCCGKDVSDGKYWCCSICSRYLCYGCFDNPKDKEKLKEISPSHPCSICMSFVDEYQPDIEEFTQLWEDALNAKWEVENQWGKRSRGELDE